MFLNFYVVFFMWHDGQAFFDKGMPMRGHGTKVVRSNISGLKRKCAATKICDVIKLYDDNLNTTTKALIDTNIFNLHCVTHTKIKIRPGAYESSIESIKKLPQVCI